MVQVVQLLLEPNDVGLDAGPDGHSGTGEAVPLRYQHGHHLLSAGHQRVEGLGLGVPEGTQGRTDGLGEVSQDRRIQGIGLGQPPSGLGKVPTWRGLTTTTGREAAAKAATKGSSSPPEASSTKAAGPSCCIWATSAAIPAWSLQTSRLSPPGRMATSTWPWPHRSLRRYRVAP